MTCGVRYKVALIQPNWKFATSSRAGGRGYVVLGKSGVSQKVAQTCRRHWIFASFSFLTNVHSNAEGQYCTVRTCFARDLCWVMSELNVAHTAEIWRWGFPKTSEMSMDSSERLWGAEMAVTAPYETFCLGRYLSLQIHYNGLPWQSYVGHVGLFPHPGQYFLFQ